MNSRLVNGGGPELILWECKFFFILIYFLDDLNHTARDDCDSQTPFNHSRKMILKVGKELEFVGNYSARA